MADHDDRSLLAIARQAARAAGKVLQNPPEHYLTINAEDARDVKLQADLESETLIREQLQAATPSFPIIGEEQGGEASLVTQDQLYWVIDPLDGTYNYLRNVPLCCVSLGLMRGVTPLLGVIVDFNTNDEYYALATDSGITLNGQMWAPQWAANKQEACILTGFPAARTLSTESLHDFVEEIRQYKKVRLIGSAALALAYVATGRGDVYHEDSTRLWDVAGGLALAQAAGCYTRLEPVTNVSLAFNVWAAGREDLLG